MTAPAPALERLADVAALERPAQAKRMLVIVNPYATTMSDRLKHLVVYALQGRYDVTAVDTQRKGHAIELVAEAARERYDVVVAFGGDGTVNEAANGLAGTGTPLTCLPGGSNNVFGKMIGIPNDVVGRHGAPAGPLPDRWEPHAVDLGPRQRPRFTFAAGMGLDASVVERVDANPAMKRRFGHWYFTEKAVGTFMRKYLVAPAQALGQRRRRRPDRRRERLLPERPALHLLQGAARQPHRGARLDSGDLAGVVLRVRTPSTCRP